MPDAILLLETILLVIRIYHRTIIAKNTANSKINQGQMIERHITTSLIFAFRRLNKISQNIRMNVFCKSLYMLWKNIQFFNHLFVHISTTATTQKKTPLRYTLSARAQFSVHTQKSNIDTVSRTNSNSN